MQMLTAEMCNSSNSNIKSMSKLLTKGSCTVAVPYIYVQGWISRSALVWSQLPAQDIEKSRGILLTQNFQKDEEEKTFYVHLNLNYSSALRSDN